MREIFKLMPSWWVLLVIATIYAASVFGFLWCTWIIALALGLEP